ncbi:MAG: agmatinase [Pseudohongiellaceae bacterium]
MASDLPLFTGSATFLRRPACEGIALSEAQAMILGAPFDLATTGRAGARSGPAAIRQASANLVWEETRWPWDFDAAECLSVVDVGDVNPVVGNPRAFVEALEGKAAEVIAAGKSLITLGGDHYISLPLLRAHVKKHGPLALIHFDAHTDTYGDGGEFDHGTMFIQALNEGLLQADRSIQIGIRTAYDYQNHPFEVMDAAWVNEHSAAQCVARIIERVGEAKAYLSFDIDCLDPAHAPATGTPVVGGLSSDRALQIVRGLTGLSICGFDLVEVAPSYDVAEVTALAGATLTLEFLYLLAAAHRNRGPGHG